MNDQQALARLIYLRLIEAQYELPKEGMNDQWLEDIAGTAVRASKVFEEVWADRDNGS